MNTVMQKSIVIVILITSVALYGAEQSNDNQPLILSVEQPKVSSRILHIRRKSIPIQPVLLTKSESVESPDFLFGMVSKIKDPEDLSQGLFFVSKIPDQDRRAMNNYIDRILTFGPDSSLPEKNVSPFPLLGKTQELTDQKLAAITPKRAMQELTAHFVRQMRIAGKANIEANKTALQQKERALRTNRCLLLTSQLATLAAIGCAITASVVKTCAKCT